MLLRPEILLYGMHFMGTAELKNSNTREEHRRIYGLMFLRAEILLYGMHFMGIAELK